MQQYQTVNTFIIMLTHFVCCQRAQTQNIENQNTERKKEKQIL